MLLHNIIVPLIDVLRVSYVHNYSYKIYLSQTHKNTIANNDVVNYRNRLYCCLKVWELQTNIYLNETTKRKQLVKACYLIAIKLLQFVVFFFIINIYIYI